MNHLVGRARHEPFCARVKRYAQDWASVAQTIE
jgi:hypothetical protein